MRKVERRDVGVGICRKEIDQFELRKGLEAKRSAALTSDIIVLYFLLVEAVISYFHIGFWCGVQYV